MQITKRWLKSEGACEEYVNWFTKQKATETFSVANKLYTEKRYVWCLWLLYRKTFSAPLIIWGLILLSYLLLGISFSLSLSHEPSAVLATLIALALVAVAVVALAVVAAVVASAAVTAVTVGAAVTAGVVVASAVVTTGALGAAVAVAVVTLAAVTAVDTDVATKLICKIVLKRGRIR